MMRLDLPHELPRRPERKQTPLEPGPVAGIREQLEARARENRWPTTSRRFEHPAPIKQPHENEARALPQHHQLERRPRRTDLPLQAVGLALRAEEQKVLTDIARFRVIATRDLAKTIYGNHTSQMERDLTFLRQQGLIEVNTVNMRRDGRVGCVQRLEVATLTKAGQRLVRETGGLPESQKLYAGLVKPREVEHDSQIYRAYLKEAERIEQAGGKNLRVQLDFELKSKVQKAIYAQRKAAPARDLTEIKQEVADKFDLPFVDNGIQIPDARIEYDLDQSSGSGHQDIEVLTAAYRPAHLRHKAQAGFHVYASSADRATLTAKIERDHHLLDHILEL
jgi:hypothetical protein